MTTFETQRIFAEMDKIIEVCKNSFPVPYQNSLFRKLYEKLKKEEGCRKDNHTNTKEDTS